MPPKSQAERMKAYRKRKRVNDASFADKEKERHCKYRTGLTCLQKTKYNQGGIERKRKYRERVKSAIAITAAAQESDDGDDEPVPGTPVMPPPPPPIVTSPYGSKQAEGNCFT